MEQLSSKTRIGMHTLMSFIGCIGSLMNGSGLEELLSAAFKGVSHMLNGKAWPKAVRGLRMVSVCTSRTTNPIW